MALTKFSVSTSDILRGYLKRSPGSALSFYGFRMFIWYFENITVMKNENFSVFTKNDDQGLPKGWNLTVHGDFEDLKKISDLQSKIYPVCLFKIIDRIIWYHSRGHRTKIDSRFHSRTKKKQNYLIERPFRIIGSFETRMSLSGQHILSMQLLEL